MFPTISLFEYLRHSRPRSRTVEIPPPLVDDTSDMGSTKEPEEKRAKCLRVFLRWIVFAIAFTLSVVQVRVSTAHWASTSVYKENIVGGKSSI